MRISTDVLEAIYTAINEGLSQGIADPKRILTERDAESWIFCSLIQHLECVEPRLGVHCQTRFYNKNDGSGLLRIIPDIAIFDYDAYSIECDGESYLRKGYSFNGSSVLIEIKMWRGHDKPDINECLEDIDKLASLHDLHYAGDPDNDGFLIFVLYSRPPLDENVVASLQRRATEKGVKLIWQSANRISTLPQTGEET